MPFILNTTQSPNFISEVIFMKHFSEFNCNNPLAEAKLGI